MIMRGVRIRQIVRVEPPSHALVVIDWNKQESWEVHGRTDLGWFHDSIFFIITTSNCRDYAKDVKSSAAYRRARERLYCLSFEIMHSMDDKTTLPSLLLWNIAQWPMVSMPFVSLPLLILPFGTSQAMVHRARNEGTPRS